MQPFNLKFNKRYKDIYKPAIETTECEPYRVDEDHSVANIMVRVREKIKAARICLADITEDNPNVWYEVGYAHALGKQIVLISEKKDKIPFDMSGEKVIFYHTSSASDFDALKEKITKTVYSRLNASNNTPELQQSYQEKTEGLSREALSVMRSLMLVYPENLSAKSLQNTENQGLFHDADSAVFFGLTELEKEDFIKVHELDHFGRPYREFTLTKSGRAWAIKNKHVFPQTMHTPQSNSQPSFDDDMPF